MKNLFDLKHFKGDLLGGITAGIVALPLALAFGVSSGLGPSAGLYGAIFVGFFAALFGGTNTQISGPTAPMTAVSMVIIAGIVGMNEGNIKEALPAILTVFLLAGVFQIILGFLKIGTYIKYIPTPVVSGFMSAIGIIILVTQILPSIGYYADEDTKLIDNFKPQAEEVILEKILKKEAAEGILVTEHLETTIAIVDTLSNDAIMLEAKTLANKEASGVLGTIRVLPRALKAINWLELCLALGTILIIYGFKKITTAIPSTLVALIIMSGVAIGMNLTYIKIDTIPSGLPTFNGAMFYSMNLGSITPYILSALTLAFLGAIDSLLTSVVADNMTKTKHKPNRDLIGQGIGNSIGAVFGGLPGAGATIRTVVNIKAGGKTRISGMIAGLFLFAILLTIAPFASKIPAAVLAGILITVGIGVMDYKGLKAIPKMPRTEVLIMLTVLLVASFYDLITAVGIGLVLASLIFMKKMGDLTVQGSWVKSAADADSHDSTVKLPSNLEAEVFVKRMNGPLFFGSTSDIQELTKTIPSTATTLVIQMSNVSYMDQSGVYAMEEIISELETKDIKILIVGIPDQSRKMLKKVGLIPKSIPHSLIFDSMDECMKWVIENVEDEV
ncbi:MAG: SulP family inorganic anion transporter [Crocinitomicaceae bacterium]|nr:SulP family inorganic anion transporter [Crocinitomicaceae bacterium]